MIQAHIILRGFQLTATIENHCPSGQWQLLEGRGDRWRGPGAISRVLATHGEDTEELAEFMYDLKIT